MLNKVILMDTIMGSHNKSIQQGEEDEMSEVIAKEKKLLFQQRNHTCPPYLHVNRSLFGYFRFHLCNVSSNSSLKINYIFCCHGNTTTIRTNQCFKHLFKLVALIVHLLDCFFLVSMATT